MLVTLVLSPWLSQLTFGNKNYTLAFIWLSVTLLFNQLTNGQMALLQGVRKLKYLAKSNLYGSALGLIITVPLYYKFGLNGIVPVLIVASVISLSLSYYFSHKTKILPIKVSKVRTIAEGKVMLSMGIMISLSGLFTIGAAYIVRIFISRYGSIADVGLFTAGFTIINTYVGIVFSAMWTDYYPRLSEVSKSNKLSKQTINHQAELALLILGPILIFFLVFINWIIIILYSTKFIDVSAMIYWAALGMFFKTINWAIATLFMAKGSGKLYLFNEMTSNLYQLALNLVGYYLWGLTGLGLSFLVGNFIYLIQVYMIAKIKFEFNFDNALIKIFVFQFLLALFSFFAVKFLKQPFPYITGVVLISISVGHSLKELDKRLDIKAIIHSYTHK